MLVDKWNNREGWSSRILHDDNIQSSAIEYGRVNEADQMIYCSDRLMITEKSRLKYMVNLSFQGNLI